MTNFEALKSIINANGDQKSMDNAVEAWEIDINDNFIGELVDRAAELNIDNVPYALDSLFRSDEKFKNIVFCVLFEQTCEELPFIGNLERYPMFRAKMELMYHTFAGVYSACYNGIGDCAGLIIINNDPELELADDDSRERIIESTAEKLRLIREYIERHGCKEDEVVDSLAVTLDMSTYANNDEVIAEIKKLAELELHPECRLFLAKTMAHNKIDGALEIVRELASFDASRVMRVLESTGNTEILDKSGITQEQIAYSEMRNWLLYPTECGDSLDKLEVIDNFMYNDFVYYAFRFTSTAPALAERGEMLAVSGGYSTKGISDNLTGHTFSKFEPVEKDHIKQAIEIIKLISGYWKKRAEEEEDQD